MFTERDGEVQMLGPKTDARYRGCTSALGRCNSHDDVDLIRLLGDHPLPATIEVRNRFGSTRAFTRTNENALQIVGLRAHPNRCALYC